MVCMTTSMASGNLILSPRLELRNSSFEGWQVSALRLQGAVNWKVGEKSTHLFALTTTRRKARRSPSIVVRNEATDAEPKADLEQEERDERYSTEQSAMLQRRQLVWAATGAFSYLSSAGIVQSASAASPVPPTNFASKDCRLVGINPPGSNQDCCQPDGSRIKPKPFRFENLPLRTRMPAHVLSKNRQYVEKYNEAYRRMNALPPEDPRSFRNQWRIHCSFCNGVYPEPGNAFRTALQYHGSWAFLPWHRMYLYFHERILGELIGDRSFALPFWNWDNQRRADGGNQMPPMFVEDWGPLNDNLRSAIRDLQHYPPTHVNLTNPYPPAGQDYNTLRTDNLSLLHTAVVSTVSPRAFLGGAYRAGQSGETNQPGTAEQDGHNTVHVWTGGRDTPNNEDMGTFIYAGRDPIFYSHHSNVDRLWTVWQSLPPSSDETTRRGKRSRKESTDPDFRNTEFAFYDHNKDIVIVKVADTLDNLKLSFKYQAVDSDKDWINFRKRPSGAPKPSQPDIAPFAKRDPIMFKDQPSSFQLLRRAPTDSEAAAEGFAADDVEETLLIKGAKLSMNSFTLFKVFINLPGADATTPLDVQEFAGLISHVPHARIMGGAEMSDQVYTLRVSLGAVMKNLNIADDEAVSITFVPGAGQSEDVTFDDLTVEFD